LKILECRLISLNVVIVDWETIRVKFQVKFVQFVVQSVHLCTTISVHILDEIAIGSI
jgi:hypothetical protein